MVAFTLPPEDALSAPPRPGLHLMGLGPGDLELAPLATLQRAAGCTVRHLEAYTSSLPRSERSRLEAMVGPVDQLGRDAIEQPGAWLDRARDEPVALLIVGDPLQATTHHDLIHHCHERGIDVHLVHAASVTTLATGTLGLSSYRFGRQITLPWQRGEFLPTSPLELHCEAHALGLHTLALLDLDPLGAEGHGERYMTAAEALTVLTAQRARLLDDPPPHLDEPETPQQEALAAAVAARLATEPASWPAVLAADLGTAQERRLHGSLAALSAAPPGRIHCLVLLGRLATGEAEALAARCVSV